MSTSLWRPMTAANDATEAIAGDLPEALTVAPQTARCQSSASPAIV
jgi:hypothetical protein